MTQDRRDEILDSLLLEMRRGTIVLSVMSQLSEPQYGYSLVVLLEEKGISVDAGTLYPLLRRLESQGVLESSWDTESAKPRKYYKLSPYGASVYEKLCIHWSEMVGIVNRMIDSKE